MPLRYTFWYMYTLVYDHHSQHIHDFTQLHFPASLAPSPPSLLSFLVGTLKIYPISIFQVHNRIINPIQKAMALQYSCLENSMDGEPGRLQSMGSLRDGHNWATSFSLLLSCIGEGNGNPLQCSFLENPRDGGAWWAAVYGVAQSQTRLKWLSSTLHTLDVQSEFVLPNWNYTWTNTSPFPPPSSPWQLSFHIPFLGVWLF